MAMVTKKKHLNMITTRQDKGLLEEELEEQTGEITTSRFFLTRKALECCITVLLDLLMVALRPHHIWHFMFRRFIVIIIIIVVPS